MGEPSNDNDTMLLGGQPAALAVALQGFGRLEVAAASARAVADGLLRRDVGALVDALRAERARSAPTLRPRARGGGARRSGGRAWARSSWRKTTRSRSASRRLSTRSAGSARRPPQMPLPPKARGGGAVEGGAHNY